MFEYYIRTSPTSRRTNSYHFHHDHRDHSHSHRHHYRTRCFDNCAGISLEQWNTLCDQNKSVLASNEALTCENQTLKNDLSTSNAENARLVACNQQLGDEIEGLRRSLDRGENAERFRRRVAALRAEVGGKEKDVHRLEKDNASLVKENATLTTRVKVLTETVSGLFGFERLYEDFKERYEKARRLLAARTKELDESNALVDEQRRMLRRYETPLPPRRRYSFV
ncbi:uncharacterized protein F4822DRAFT_429623 [Hypoxylon trugodes]|uniref:uncharacterized protein n=1 Tax=Hypoxylon trugodes TaxID=326681 RepID=UPI00219066D0|nr:uncharacterized protein F4822DRAFT_429623 [Hypoxylon trugodes]KAI1389009.1 hypothetical protein F4822DRAFT_429623 [Hypoxylon trugodes]